MLNNIPNSNANLKQKIIIGLMILSIIYQGTLLVIYLKNTTLEITINIISTCFLLFLLIWEKFTRFQYIMCMKVDIFGIIIIFITSLVSFTTSLLIIFNNVNNNPLRIVCYINVCLHLIYLPFITYYILFYTLLTIAYTVGTIFSCFIPICNYSHMEAVVCPTCPQQDQREVRYMCCFLCCYMDDESIDLSRKLKNIWRPIMNGVTKYMCNKYSSCISWYNNGDESTYQVHSDQILHSLDGTRELALTLEPSLSPEQTLPPNSISENKQGEKQLDAKLKEICKCVICLEDINDSDSVYLQCRHYYHNSCIVNWKKVKNTCPVCRRYI